MEEFRILEVDETMDREELKNNQNGSFDFKSIHHKAYAPTHLPHDFIFHLLGFLGQFPGLWENKAK